MKRFHVLIITIVVTVLVTGCTSQKTRMQKKEQSAASEARITLTKKYTQCVTDAGADTAAIEACDAILDSIKKLE